MLAVYNFGREDPGSREALQRLVAAITRFLDPDEVIAASADGLACTKSRPMGGAWVLDGLHDEGGGTWGGVRNGDPLRMKSG